MYLPLFLVINFPFIKIGATAGVFLSDKKDHNIDHYNLIRVNKSTNLFERYMKYMVLYSLIALTSSLLVLLNWKNAIESKGFVTYFL